MLVLSRGINETIMIGDNIEVFIVDVKGGKVKLGIKAPTSISVHRKEIYEIVRNENELASRHAGISSTNLENLSRIMKSKIK